jgi:hypothetical protein
VVLPQVKAPPPPPEHALAPNGRPLQMIAMFASVHLPSAVRSSSVWPPLEPSLVQS